MKVSEITEILDKWMPRSIAEDFDNVGLLIGDSNSEVKNILVTPVSYTHLTLPTTRIV